MAETNIESLEIIEKLYKSIYLKDAMVGSGTLEEAAYHQVMATCLLAAQQAKTNEMLVRIALALEAMEKR